MSEITKLPLKKCKLWWPAWQMGIPFNSYGYTNQIAGPGYTFNVSDMDSWLCDICATGARILMPIATAKFSVPFTSFTIISQQKVQVNYRIPGTDSYQCKYYNIDDLYWYGETYEEDI